MRPERLNRNEAAVLAVFDPDRFHSLSDLFSAVERTVGWSKGMVIDSRFETILQIDQSRIPQNCPWTWPPRWADGVLVFRLRQFRDGNAAAMIRKMAVAAGVAVLDLVTELVFADLVIQSRFQGENWKPLGETQPEAGWLRVGEILQHTTFGEGRLLDIADYKKMRTLVIQFSDEVKLISLEFGLPHIRPAVVR